MLKAFDDKFFEKLYPSYCLMHFGYVFCFVFVLFFFICLFLWGGGGFDYFNSV